MLVGWGVVDAHCGVIDRLQNVLGLFTMLHNIDWPVDEIPSVSIAVKTHVHALAIRMTPESRSGNNRCNQNGAKGSRRRGDAFR